MARMAATGVHAQLKGSITNGGNRNTYRQHSRAGDPAGGRSKDEVALEMMKFIAVNDRLWQVGGRWGRLFRESRRRGRRRSRRKR